MDIHNEPPDVVDGPDPAYTEFTISVVQAIQAECRCGYKVVGTQEQAVDDVRQHIAIWHQARHNPELTCHTGHGEAHIYRDGKQEFKSLCVRPKGHDGKHWTPGWTGGFEW